MLVKGRKSTLFKNEW